MSAESPRHVRSGGGPLTVPSQPPSDRSIIDTVSGLINDITLSSSSTVDPKDVIQWARFETADINEPTPEGDSDIDISPLLLILGYGSGVQVWLIPPAGEAQEVLSWRQGTVRVLRILPTPQRGDCFASKRPLIALCDSASTGPSFCSLSFISIRGGEQVKNIKFKNQILDVLANKRSVVISFPERFAVFDAGTLEDRMTVTTCYPCPCPLGGSTYINPLTLGDRWLAYADKKLNQSKRSSGGCEAEGVTSYTATVLHAAKSLSKGLRGLGESVAHSLAGGRPASQSPSPPNTDLQHPGIVTVLDIEGIDEEEGQDCEEPYDPVVAHFVAHSEAITALKWDSSGVLLVTADRRGHDFHVFRVNPHPCGSHLASVHHLYILHRGDTTAKVQDIAVSSDSRWAAVSTLRGTTHVFAISPYGGACGVRTHTHPRVVNRLSRFHRSAGLPIHPHHHAAAAAAAAAARSASPVSEGIGAGAWFPNPRLPPYPAPTTAAPLAQLRPTHHLPTHTITRTSSGRQRLSSVSEDSSSPPLLARAAFGSTAGGAGGARASPALYLMAANGCLLHLLLHPRPARNVPKEKISDESPIEVDVEGVAQWRLQRPPAGAAATGDLLAPLPPSNPLLAPLSCRRCSDICMSEEERWLSQVEIVTHAGPHRRLWMGPQFVFKTYNCTGSNSSLSEAETVEVETSAARSVARSNPVNMPGARPLVPVIVDSGSASSLEHSPSDSFRRKSLLAESGRAASVCDVQLKEDLAEAMKEDHGWKESRVVREVRREVGAAATIERVVDPLGTVVVPLAAQLPLPDDSDDPDVYTTSNADEATFRPVVRAPAALPLHPDIVVRPLPRDTTIPVQTVTSANLSPQGELRPLSTGVVIPVALTTVYSDNFNNGFENRYVIDNLARESVQNIRSDRKSFETYDSQKIISNETVTDVIKSVDSDSVDVKAIDVNKDLKGRGDVCKDVSARERGSVITERESKDNLSLPKSNRPPDDIQPAARTRYKKSPTPKSLSDKVSDVRVKNNYKELKELKDEKVEEIKVNRELPEAVGTQVLEPQKAKFIKGAIETGNAIESKGAKKFSEEMEPKVSKSVPKNIKDNKANQPKHTEVPDLTENYAVKESGNKQEIKSKKTPDVTENYAVKESGNKQEIKSKKIPDLTENYAVKESGNKHDIKSKKIPDLAESYAVKESGNKQEIKSKKMDLKEKKEHNKKVDSFVEVAKALPSVKSDEIEIKTEDQAWDMLLNEHEKPILNFSKLPITSEKSNDDTKHKSKKNRKREDKFYKTEEDSFVEIHAIDEKVQPSGELVSISTPFEENDTSISYVSRCKKSRSPKSITPERKNVQEITSFENLLHQDSELFSNLTFKVEKSDDIEIIPEPVEVKATYDNKYATSSLNTAFNDENISECSSFSSKSQLKSKKCKSLSTYSESRKTDKQYETEQKDVYVINTTEEDFPDIQITRGKQRKKSPQPLEKVQAEFISEKSPVSWSAIAASKNVKKVEDMFKKTEVDSEKVEHVESIADIGKQKIMENPIPSKRISLQDKLIELCKRTDIIVAECDAPTELNFVDEHHSVLHDLPPLEPLEFGLDDFKLEVMRDSLLEVNSPPSTHMTSPICEINIDDILSSIKDTTSKAIESSMFNLVDLERLPAKNEKGFSVIEDHKITTSEVKVDDDFKLEDQITKLTSVKEPFPILSSVHEEKNSSDASKLILSSSRRSTNKAKKEKEFSIIEDQKITTSEVKGTDDFKEGDIGKVLEKYSDKDSSRVLSTDIIKGDKKNAELSKLLLPSFKRPVNKAKKEIGSSVYDDQKNTILDVNVGGDFKVEQKGESIEKSSDEDPSPVLSTDSDKEDKKNTGASKIILPSSKQSAVAKKSRRKKK